MYFRIRILLLQLLSAIGLLITLSGFSLLAFSAEGKADLSTLSRYALGLGFGLLLLVCPILAYQKCPRCGKQFCGTQDETDHHIGTNIFTSECKYCHFSIRQ
jgi:hypothetical protein